MDPSTKSIGGGQMLVAAREGDAPGVARLLAAGADPNACSAPWRTPSGAVLQSTALYVATLYGYLEAA